VQTISNDFDFANDAPRRPRKKSGCGVWLVFLGLGVFSCAGLCCIGVVVEWNKTPEQREREQAARKKAEEETAQKLADEQAKRELTGAELATSQREFVDITYIADRAKQKARLEEWKSRYPQLGSKLDEKRFWEVADRDRAENAALEEFAEITGIQNKAERDRRVDEWGRRNPTLVKRMHDRIKAASK
jgi:hypothetical protein